MRSPAVEPRTNSAIGIHMRNSRMALQLSTLRVRALAASLLLSSPLLAQSEAERALTEGRRAMVEQRVDDAAKNFQKAASLEPKNAVYQVWLGRACPEVEPIV